jgi:hypothetical protein
MEQQQPEQISPQAALAEKQKWQKAWIELKAYCLRSITAENQSLYNDVHLLNDFILWGGVDKFATLRSVLYSLNDQSEVTKLTQEAKPGTMFYKNIPQVTFFADRLKHWLREQLISNATTLVQASVILEYHLEKNKLLLEEK